jgi:hypothetical protein
VTGDVERRRGEEEVATMPLELTRSTWVTRRVPGDIEVQWAPVDRPVVGDVLACEVGEPSLHGWVETADGRRARLYQGDRILCVVGNRYATSKLEGVGEVDGEMVDLLSASGLCGKVLSLAERSAPPTKLWALAQAQVDGIPLNVRSLTLGPPAAGPEPLWIVVVGSTMDAGMTSACASIIHGLCSAGRRVGAAKLTGTARAWDVSGFRDAGAEPALDVLDVGWPSTAGCGVDEMRDIVLGLTGQLRAADIEVGVLHVADGLLQRETNIVLRALPTWLGPAKCVLAAKESLAAVVGVMHLARMGHSVAAVSGEVTNSPLACREIVSVRDASCVRTADLGEFVESMLGTRAHH